MWKDLTLKEKAEIMKMSVANGVTDINDIKAIYDNETHNYQLGGYKQWKNAIAKYKHLDINNDPTYDYEGFYNSDPVRAWSLLNEDPNAHFVDNFKTAQHPTFSKESDYSGKFHPIYNPRGVEGGTWGNRSFTLSKDWQKGPSLQDRISYLEDAEDEGVTLYGPNGELPVIYNNDVWGGVLPNVDIYKKALGGHLFKDGGRPNWSHDPASMIEHFEGFRESPYRDGTAWSVGYGQYMKGYGANLDWDALLSGRKKLSRSEAHQQVLRTVEDLKKQLRRTLGDKLYNSLTPGQLMGYLDTGYQRPASMIRAAQVHRTKGAEAAASVLGVNGFADRNAARRAAFTGNWNNYKPTGNTNQHMPNVSTGADYNRQMLNILESPAFQPIALNSPNTSSTWIDYISKIGQQSPIAFNTPIGATNIQRNNVGINLIPTDFSVLSGNGDLMSPLEPYAAKQAIEYGLGLENNALWNSPYLMFDSNYAANGGHLFGDGSMLLKDNAVNPALQYVYGPDYDRIVRAKRSYRPTGNIRRSRPVYDIKQQADVVANTTRPTQRKIKIAQEVESPARRKKEEEIATNRHLQYIRERQGSIQPQPNTLHHPDYNPKFAQEVEELRRKEAEEALKRAPVDNFIGSVLEGMEAIPWPSRIVGSLTHPDTHGPFSFLSNLYANDNRGFFNFNQATRDFYDANPEVGETVNFFGDFIAPGAASKVLKGASNIPRASRNLFASAAINYGAKTRKLPTNIYKSRNLFINGPFGEWIADSDPFVEFINTKRNVPSNTSFFLRAPRDIDILKLRDGRYRAKAQGNVIVPSGSVDGMFVSYGEPWMEFGTNDLAAWYEFPTSTWKSSKKVGGRGPYRTATDWRGNEMDYDVTDAWNNMVLRQNPKFIAEEKAMYENLRSQKFNSSRERVQAHRNARKQLYEKWGYNPDINLDVYHGNQTVIPRSIWNFNSEHPRGFLSQPFWRYTQDPYSGAVQKELMMNWPKLDIIPNGDLLKITENNLPTPRSSLWDWHRDIALFNDDQSELQRLRDLHFKVASGIDPQHWYHGTQRRYRSFDPYAEPTTFEGSGGTTFMANLYPVAAEYGIGPTGRVLDLYANVHNPKVIDYAGAAFNGNGTVITYIDPILGKTWVLEHPNGTKYFPFGYYEGSESTNLITHKVEVPLKDWGWVPKEDLKYNKHHVTYSSSQNAEQAINEGYDAALLKNIVEGVYKNRRINIMNNDLAVRDGRLLKLANPLTFDENGNLIRLSLRDNFFKNDMNFRLGGYKR